MFFYVLISSLLVAVTVIIHAFGSTLVLRYLAWQRVGADAVMSTLRVSRILIGTVLLLVVLHVVEIMIWALAYRNLLPDSELQSFEEAVYFSFVTFTTLGYGDISLTGVWRVMSGVEALNGILLVGWSTATLFAVVQRVWQSRYKHIGHAGDQNT
jgi:hypothetical protein